MSHPLDAASPGEATEVRCLHCQGRVLLVHHDRGKARTNMALHLIDKHEDALVDGSIVLEGTDFTCTPAGYRCDLCLAPCEPPWWTYMTPATPTFAVQDPGWLVCDSCHELIITRDKPLRVLTERSLRMQQRELILDDIPERELVATIKASIKSFLDHRQGEPVRDSMARGQA